MGRTLKRISLTAWIFMGMAAGVALGIVAPGFARQLSPVSRVFLQLIRSIIAHWSLQRWWWASRAAAT